MDSVIYNPLEEYENKFKASHAENTKSYFDSLVKTSGVNIEENRETVSEYEACKESLTKLKNKLNLYRFLRVIMIVTLILIPLVIMKTTPKIKSLREKIESADKKAEELLAKANEQMLPLNRLFSDRDALNIIESTIPLISFDNYFTIQQERDMQVNFDLCELNECEQSTLDVLAGKYNENPFFFENKIIHSMGTETYHGYKTISWTETYRDGNGKLRTRTRTDTLHATLVKPKPYYYTQVVLNYGSQGGPELSFSRDASHLETKSEKDIKRHIKRGEKKLKKMTDKAISENKDFTSMSNSDFEVLFDALDRTNEVQYRTLFTPLAQTNMVDLILSKTAYGDDFNFIKVNRMNKVISNHSQQRAINITAGNYISYSFDVIKEKFENINTEFFKAVYFDFAPLLAIPAYQEKPIHSLKPIPDYKQLCSQKESEALANIMDAKYTVHPNTKTQAILKSNYIATDENADEICITSYSYDIIPRVSVVSVMGNDGHYHDVPVQWDEYVPLQTSNNFYISKLKTENNSEIIANRNGLCIFK